MAGNSSNQQIQLDGRHPLTAAALSVVPGLGQLYMGETRKGILFLDVSVVNFLILWAILFTEPISKSIIAFGNSFHCHVDSAILTSLRHLHFGSPAATIILAMMFAFAFLAARDAYDKAILPQRKSLYGEAILDLDEAASGSYLMHFAVIGALAILAVFFVAPRPMVRETVTIQFMTAPQQFERPRTPVHTAALTHAADHGMRNPHEDTHLSQSSAASSAARAMQAAAQAAQSAMRSIMTPPRHEVNPQPTASRPAPPTHQPTPQTPSHIAPMPTPHAIASANLPNVTPLPRTSAPAPQTSNIMPKPISSAAPPAPTVGAPKPITPGQATAAPMPELHSTAGASHAPAVPTIAAPSSAQSSFASGIPAPTATSSAPAGSGGHAPSLPVGGGHKGAFAAGPSMPSGITGDTNSLSHDSGAPAPFAPSGGRQGHPSGPGGTDKGPAPSRFAGNRDAGSNGPLALAPNLPAGPGTKGERGNNNQGRRSGPSNNGESMNPEKSVDAKSPSIAANPDVDFTDYMKKLQSKIRRHWFPPHDPRSRKVVALFSIRRDGELSQLRLRTPSGLSIADTAAITAIQNSAPFDHLPDGSPASVDIEFSFDYNVFSH